MLTEEIDSLAAVPDTVEVMEVVEEEPMVRLPQMKVLPTLSTILQLTKSCKCRVLCSPCLIIRWIRRNISKKKDWKHDPLFSQLDSYTVLFDKAVDMEAEKDTTATSVKIEWIYLKTNKIKRYYFERLKGLWKLEAIDFADMPENEDSKESFYEFYEHFANDSLFQQTRLHNPLKFVTVDPDDEFQIIETTLEAGQWFAFFSRYFPASF